MSNLNTSGERIKLARNMLGLNRQDMERKFQISHNTLQAWEIDRLPLSKKGATRLSKVLLGLGLICSEEWLLHGSGQFPFFLKEKQEFFDNFDDEINILREAEVFRTLNPDPVVLMVPDDGMHPKFALGDYIGGNKRTGNDIKKLIGTDCIVTSIQGDTFIRRLLVGEKESCYTLSCINPYTDQPPIISNIVLTSAAQVVWHRTKEILK